MLINMGVIGTGGSGSVAGQTLSHNRFGYYLRARTSPVNPNSGRQMTARAIFAGMAGAWSSLLTEVQREAWNQYAAAIAWVNAIGATVYLTGFNHFLRSSTAIIHAAGVPVVAGPTILTLPESDPSFDVAVDEAGQEMSITFDNVLGWANEDGGHMLVSMSSPKGTGRDFIGGPYRVAGSIDGDAITPPVSPLVLPVPFIVAEGQKVDCRARILRADGRVSNYFQITTTVIA